MFNWTLKEIPIKDLKDHAKNPRQIGKRELDRLSGLIEKFGLIDKPICNLDLGLIAGHQRIKILKKKKVKKVECWIPDVQLSQEEVDELLIGHNLHQGSFDYDILANLWEPLDLLTYGFTEEKLLGLSKEAEKIVNTLADEEVEGTEYDESCTYGLDVIVRFNIKIPNEDSTSFENQLKSLLEKFPRAKLEKKV